MKTRYLILTDIHANIDDLEAIEVLYHKLLVLGDFVDYGAALEEAVRSIREKNPIAVSGNHDFAMPTGADCRSSPISYAFSGRAVQRLEATNLSADVIAKTSSVLRHAGRAA